MILNHARLPIPPHRPVIETSENLRIWTEMSSDVVKKGKHLMGNFLPLTLGAVKGRAV